MTIPQNAVSIESYATAINQRMGRFEQWARERNFYARNGATYAGQFLKLMEECGELAGGMARNSQERIKDAIGDVLCVLAVMRGFTPREEWKEWSTLSDETLAPPPVCSTLADVVDTYTSCVNHLLGSLCDFAYVTLEAVADYLGSIAMYYKLTLIECLDHVWGEIKDRQGIMYNGVFIKDSDPRYAELAYEGKAPCIDEGCPQHGTMHYCVTPVSVHRAAELAAQDVGCSAIDVRSMLEDDVVDN